MPKRKKAGKTSGDFVSEKPMGKKEKAVIPPIRPPDKKKPKLEKRS